MGVIGVFYRTLGCGTAGMTWETASDNPKLAYLVKTIVLVNLYQQPIIIYAGFP
jgi:hypothetical protein